MVKSPKHGKDDEKDFEPEDVPVKAKESGADEPKPEAGSLEQRVAKLEHQLNVLAPLAELLPAVTQLRRLYGGV